MDRATVIGRLKLAEEHVAQGKRLIARQHELIAELTQKGRDTKSAEDILNTLSDTQASFESDLERFQAQLAE